MIVALGKFAQAWCLRRVMQRRLCPMLKCGNVCSTGPASW